MDKGEFIQFYNRYINDIYRFVYFRVDSEEIAQDLSSEAFLRFWQTIAPGVGSSNVEGGLRAIFTSTTKPIENPRALVYQIARNLVADFFRHKSKLGVVLASSLPEFIQIPDRDDLIEKISIQSDMDQVKAAIKKIKPEQQEAVLLRYVEEMEIKEIANILEKSEGATRVLIHRGLEELKRILN